MPTVDELGYKGYNVEVWFGVMAPAKTPKEATAQLASWFQAALKAPELTPRLLKLGLYPVGTCLDDFASPHPQPVRRIRPHHPRRGHQGR